MLPAIVQEKTLVNNVPKPNNNNLAPVIGSNRNTVVIGNNNRNIQIPTKNIQIHGATHKVDPEQLMNMIRYVTMVIGDLKKTDNVYSQMMLNGLRSSRREMISTLEEHFRLHWRVNDNGESIFYLQ